MKLVREIALPPGLFGPRHFPKSTAEVTVEM
jgi:hypothetical protein